MNAYKVYWAGQLARLALCLLLVWTVGSVVIGAANSLRTATSSTQVIHRCQEDEACWDCHEMGNRVCGPTLEVGAHHP